MQIPTIMKMTAFVILVFACCAGSLAAEKPATIKANGKAWTLENDVLKAVVLFQDGSIDLTSLFNKESGKECLTGPGNRLLFRHVVDGLEL